MISGAKVMDFIQTLQHFEYDYGENVQVTLEVKFCETISDSD